VAGVFASDPNQFIKNRLEKLKELGGEGITNWPVAGFINSNFSRAPGKWTIRNIIGSRITERYQKQIVATQALSLAQARSEIPHSENIFAQGIRIACACETFHTEARFASIEVHPKPESILPDSIKKNIYGVRLGLYLRYFLDLNRNKN